MDEEVDLNKRKTTDITQSKQQKKRGNLTTTSMTTKDVDRDVQKDKLKKKR